MLIDLQIFHMRHSNALCLYQWQNIFIIKNETTERMCAKCNYDVIIGNTDFSFTFIFHNLKSLNISDILCNYGLLHIYSLCAI